jgi:hypothetical protein
MNHGVARMDRDLEPGRRELVGKLGAHLRLDLVDDPLRLLGSAVDVQPARALGNVAAHEQDREREHRADAEREPPADVGGEDPLVEEQQRADRADPGADPEAAVDRDVDRAPIACGDQLVDGGVDRRVLAADGEPGQRAEEEEVPRGERERRRHRREDVEAQRDHEELLAAVAVRQLPEEERAQARAGDVEGAGQTDAGGAEVDPAAGLGHARRDRADDRDLQAVEDPDGAEPDHDPPVEARPR